MVNEDRPFVNLAAFCDRVLQEVDGTISLIRVIDRITLQVPDDASPREVPALIVHANAVLAFKSGPVQGTRDVSLRIRNPQGEIQETKSPFPVSFQGGNQGINLVFTLGFEAQQQGVYWVDVLVGDIALTSMPLEVLYQRQPSELARTSLPPVQG